MDAGYVDFAADRLEQHTGIDRLEARGTLRIALKLAGLNAKSVTAAQLCVVFEKLMPDELEKRDVRDGAGVCRAVVEDLSDAPAPSGGSDSSDLDAIFRRLADG